MDHIALIACASQKRDEPAPARELYQSALFQKSLRYVEQVVEPDGAFVLSAKHHLLALDEVVAPYDRTLNRMNAEERRKWGRRVLDQLRERADPEEDRFTILAGKKYRENLVPHLERVEVPLEGLGIGEQLQFLTEAVEDG